MSKTLQIAWREFLATAMTKGFLIAVLAMPLMGGLALLVVPLLVMQPAPKIEGEVAVIDATGAVFPKLQAKLAPEAFVARRRALEKRIGAIMPASVRGLSGSGQADATGQSVAAMLGDVPDLAVVAVPASADFAAEKARMQLSEDAAGSRLALLRLHDDAVRAAPGAVDGALGHYDLYVRDKLDDRFVEQLRDAVEDAIVEARMSARDLDPAQIRALTRVPRVEAQKIGVDGVREDSELVRKLLPMAFLMLMFISILTGGQHLMTSTIEEKSSRVVEVLLAAVSPTQLMAGKILGQLGVGLLMLGLYAGLGLAALFSLAPAGVLDPLLLVYLLVFFLIAFVTMASLMAAIGAAVNELREAQTLLTPVMLMLALPMMLWMPISRDPDSTFATVLSLLPPVSPFVMMLRLTSSTPPPAWQIGLSIVIGIGGVIAAVWMTGKVFRIGLLMHGKPPNMATLWRWVRMA